MMGFISLVDEIQFMLISSRHICIRSILVSFSTQNSRAEATPRRLITFPFFLFFFPVGLLRLISLCVPNQKVRVLYSFSLPGETTKVQTEFL